MQTLKESKKRTVTYFLKKEKYLQKSDITITKKRRINFVKDM